MEMIFKYDKTKKSDFLKAYTMNKLQRLMRKYRFPMKALITFSRNKKDHDGGHTCGIKLNLKGPRIYVSSNEKNFPQAIDNNIKMLKGMLEKRKSRLMFNTY